VIIGLTGGIGSGKSTVCQLFAELGAEIIDADALAREMTNMDPHILKKIRETFGEAYFHTDGTLNRGQLAHLVFGNKTELEKLNQIIHPSVIAKIREKITLFRVENPKKLLVVESAILFESHMENLFDRIIVVDTNPGEIRKRLKQRDTLTDQEIDNRLKSQMPATEKKAKANHIIPNDGDLTRLKTHVTEIFDALINYKNK
jgi:dephospho-CoA kinase